MSAPENVAAACHDRRPVAVVSGGSRGLGSTLVADFLASGWRVATFSRGCSAPLEKLLRDRAMDLYWHAADARDHEALREFVGAAIERFSRVDALVNNAAIARDGVLPTMRIAEIAEVVDTNLTASIVLSQICSRVMLRQGGGAIVNISSVHAVRGHAGVSVYSAAKAGLDGLTRSLARELGPRNIRVNAVAPGYFDSDMVAGFDAAQKARIVRRTPLGRLARADDIAKAVLFLVSDQAAFITGQTMVVDGGISC